MLQRFTSRTSAVILVPWIRCSRRSKELPVPVFKHQASFEARRLSAFVNLEAGLLRGKALSFKSLQPGRNGPYPVPVSLAKSRQKLLGAISGSPNLTFIRAGGNIGDHLIRAGTRQLLSGRHYEEIFINKPQAARQVRGHTAIVTGGGGWCRPFHGTMPKILPVIEKRFEKVVVFPSSVDTAVPEVREILGKTKATVFARERRSYEQLKELCNADLAHDCAFFFDFRPYHRPGKGTLTAYRTDAEAVSDEVPPGNEDISLSCRELDEWLWKIARHKSVETDRAHVMIAAAMLGKRVRYRASSYHKVPEIAEYALKGFPVERMS
ncbi:polysaccharide pyruvyl transferase family protein [Rubrobacter taiwanensis]|uniref:Polysaccharide pyruvyl transferase family protein n=1 Tax=Rubrobacter taiwanensis TaxID=185139 RepID=A0A4R1BS99_9ACTN|nr:polysaccharide pyruvyl transferase family protein [Rubrobacter taiwanensis]